MNSQNWVIALAKEYATESDRVAVTLSGAIIETKLELVIKARLVPIATSTDDFIEGAYAPISSFSAKIDLACRLGLISAKLCRDLHIIRKIRNESAHKIPVNSFQDMKIQNWIIELMRSSHAVKKFPDTRKRLPEGLKGDFLITVTWMLGNLERIIDGIKSIKPAKEELVYTTEIKKNEKQKI
jgi:hypothetical protein